jgi:ABC-type Fe3+/spermidine/putrescine transport system ATPase subunit
MIELEEVSFAAGATRILRGISTRIEPGTPVAILGASGAGKSTLLRLVAGLEAPTEGTIRIAGRTASTPGRIELAPRDRGISMVFQDLALWSNLSALDNVLLGLTGPRADRVERARSALGLCGIRALAARRPRELSGGEQQRVALARALAVRPRFILLDEPMSGLDLLTKEKLLAGINDIATGAGATIVLITHDPLDAVALCRRAIVLEQGGVVEQGDLQALLEEPRSAILRRFAEVIGRRAPG